MAQAGWQVLRPQPRGVAGSSGLMADVTLHDLADDVVAVIQDLGGGRAVLLGHAFGHAVSRMVATDHPGQVVAVILAASNLAKTARDVLTETGLAAERLELEITEGVLLEDQSETLNTLFEPRHHGVRISMDDFGTGYSSLSYLQRFPFDKIKIDRSFIQQLPDDAESAAIVRAIISMGSCLGMTTTVEGVETREQLAFTVAEGCTFVQGYS